MAKWPNKTTPNLHNHHQAYKEGVLFGKRESCAVFWLTQVCNNRKRSIHQFSDWNGSWGTYATPWEINQTFKGLVGCVTIHSGEVWMCCPCRFYYNILKSDFWTPTLTIVVRAMCGGRQILPVSHALICSLWIIQWHFFFFLFAMLYSSTPRALTM